MQYKGILLIDSSIELDLPLEHLSPETFPLPTLGSELKLRATELTRGIGFFCLHGLEPQRYSSETNIIIYLGVSSYIGAKRGRQDELGNMLCAFSRAPVLRRCIIFEGLMITN